MDTLKERILKDGRVITGDILKVDSFLNHQIDVNLLNELGLEFKRRFADCNITKILTIEASGIAVACIVAQHFNVPVLFAKKVNSRNLDEDVYKSTAMSYTKGQEYQIRVSKRYLSPSDNVLILDDFLANGQAVASLCDIVSQAGATLAGVGIVIEKSFQKGGKSLRQNGIRLESLARLKSLQNGHIVFE